MIFLCFALKFEADPFIDFFNLKKVHEINKVRIYKSENITAVITGSGIINAAEGLSNIFARYYKNKNDILINIGIAGGVREYKLGNIFIINKIVGINNDEYYLDVNPHPFKEIELKTILAKDINNHSSDKGVIDLEGEAYYRVAQNYVFQNNIHIIKIISDYKEDKKLDKAFVSNLIKENSKIIIDYINNLRQNNYVDEEVVRFSSEEENLINIISKNYMLSKYLEFDFKKKASDYKIRGNDLIKLLNSFSNIEADNKNDRRKKYNELIKRIEIFKD